MKITPYRLILASNSPRRKELLSGLDVEYEIFTLPDIEESYPETLPKEEVPEFLARTKASAYIGMFSDDSLLLTADTIVLLDDTILGKPADKAEAARMLHFLAGKTHRVITGVCFTSKTKQASFSDTAYVTFGELSNEEIEYYVEK